MIGKNEKNEGANRFKSRLLVDNELNTGRQQGSEHRSEDGSMLLLEQIVDTRTRHPVEGGPSSQRVGPHILEVNPIAHSESWHRVVRQQCIQPVTRRPVQVARITIFCSCAFLLLFIHIWRSTDIIHSPFLLAKKILEQRAPFLMLQSGV